MPSHNLLPFLQGELDGLCGLYSIINGLRCALISADRRIGSGRANPLAKLTDDECIDLFKVLASSLVSAKRGTQAVWDGLEADDVARLLSPASAWLGDHRSLRVLHTRPIGGKSQLAVRELHKLLAAHLAKPGTAAIVGLGSPWLHWTVVKAATPDQFVLCDSYGDDSIRLRSLAARGNGKRRGQFKASSVFLLAVGELPKRASPAEARPTPRPVAKTPPAEA